VAEARRVADYLKKRLTTMVFWHCPLMRNEVIKAAAGVCQLRILVNILPSALSIHTNSSSSSLFSFCSALSRDQVNRFVTGHSLVTSVLVQPFDLRNAPYTSAAEPPDEPRVFRTASA
jgi:hypothetical protein